MTLSDVLMSDVKNLNGKLNVTETRLRKRRRVRNLPGFYIRDCLLRRLLIIRPTCYLMRIQ